MRTFQILTIIAGMITAVLGIRCSDKAKPIESFLPAMPTDLTCVLKNGTDVLLTWRDNATNETGYRIERSAGDGNTFSVIYSLAANTESATDTSLSPGRYDYRVIVFNAAGSSPPSSITSVVVPEPVPTAPAFLRIAQRGFFSFALMWEDLSDDETGFSLERSRADSLHFLQIADLASNTVSYIDSLLDPGTQYYYRVRSYNRAGWSDYTEIVSGMTRIPLLHFNPTAANTTAGDRITLSLDLTDPLSPFFGVSMHIQFDESTLRFIVFNAGDLFGPDVIEFSEQRGNTVHVTLTLKQGAAQVGTSGKLASMTFEAVTAGNSIISIQAENLHFYDASGQEIGMPYLQIQNAQVTVH